MALVIGEPCSYQRGYCCDNNCCGCCCSSESDGTSHSSSDDGVLHTESHESHGAKTSSWTAYLHLVKGTVGPGCLSLPWAVSQLGIGPGCACIVLVAVWTSYNCWTVVRLAQRWNDESNAPELLADDVNGSVTATPYANDVDDAAIERDRRDTKPITYPMLSNWLCGPRFERYTLVCMCLQQLAICTVFLSFVTTNLQAIFQSSVSLTPTTLYNETSTTEAAIISSSGQQSHYALILSLVALVCGCLVCALPNLKALAPLTTLGTGLLLTGLGLLGAVVVLVASSDQDLADHPATLPVPSRPWYTTVPLALCALLYSFEGICLVLPVQASMRQPKQFSVTFGAAMATAGILFALVAAACVAAFGPVTQGSITAFVLVRYSSSGSTSAGATSSLQQSIQLLIRLANAAVSLSVLVTYPLQLFPCLELFAPTGATSTVPTEPRHRSTPSSRYLLDNITTVPPYHTSTSALHRVASEQRELELLSMRLRGLDATPTSQYHVDAAPKLMIETDRDETLSECRCRRGPLTEATPSRVQYAELERNDLEGDHTMIPIDDADVAASVMPVAIWKDSSASSLPIKIALVGVTYMAALAIPHVETLIAVAGAVAGSSTALLIPPTLQLAYDRSGVSTRTSSALLSYTLLTGGLIFLVIGSTASIRDIIRIYTS